MVAGGRGIVAHELEYFLHVLEVMLADLLRFCVILSVVVAVGESEATLIEVGNLLFGVVRILGRAVSEEDGTAEGELQAGDDRAEIRYELELRDRVQFGLNRGQARFSTALSSMQAA